MNITIRVCDGWAMVRVGDLFADHLGKDEALGVVASALFSSAPPMYVRSYEEWVRWNERFLKLDRSGQKLLAAPAGVPDCPQHQGK